MAQDSKASAYNTGDQVQSLGWEELLEKEMATHSSILAWKIPWMEKPGRLQSMGSQRVGHDWVTSLTQKEQGKEELYKIKVCVIFFLCIISLLLLRMSDIYSFQNIFWFKKKKKPLFFLMVLMKVSVSHLVESNSLQPPELGPARLLHPWNSLDQNTGVGSYSFLQGIFHCRQSLYHLSHQGSH